MLEFMPVACALLAEGRLTYVNSAGGLLMETEPQALIGRTMADIVHPLDQGRAANRLMKLEEQSEPNASTEMRAMTALGNVRVLQVISRKVEFVSGAGAVLICAMDLTVHSEVKERLEKSEQNFRRLFESMTDVYYRTDHLGVVQMVGPGVQGVLGYRPEEIIGRTAEAYYPNPEDRDALKKAIQQHGKVVDFPGQMVRKDGKIIDISISSHLLFDEDNNFVGIEGIYRDITERAMLERKLRRLATSDALTGAANRRAFFEQAEAAFHACQAGGASLGLLMLDIDNFKGINDSYGHTIGDTVLVGFTETINDSLRHGDSLARLGGEEFCIILRDVDRQQMIDISNRLLEQVRGLAFSGSDTTDFGITVSIGGAIFSNGDTAVEHLLDRADKALYRAKQDGRNCGRFAD